MSVRLHGDRVGRSAQIEDRKPSLRSPPSIGRPAHECGVGEPRSDMTLPSAIDSCRARLGQAGGKGIHRHRLHSTCDPFGLVDDLVDLTIDDQVHGSVHVEVAVTGMQPDVDAFIGVGVAE
jgi:hypothetical protein